MKKPVQEKSADDEPVCICGYPRTGLPAIDTPCPECGSIVAAAYKGSFSYHGWNAALLGAGISVVHLLGVMVALLLDEYALNILFNEFIQVKYVNEVNSVKVLKLSLQPNAI